MTSRSIHPSLFASDQIAEVTSPDFFRPGASLSVMSVNFPLLFWSSIEFGVSGYCPGITRPPMKISRSPSWSKSAAVTTEDEFLMLGSVFLSAILKLALPSLM